MVLAVGASARITLAWRGQHGVRSMTWMWRRHHQLLHSRPVRSLYAQAQPRRSAQSTKVQTPGGLGPSVRAGIATGGSATCEGPISPDMSCAGGCATPGLGMEWKGPAKPPPVLKRRARSFAGGLPMILLIRRGVGVVG